MSPLEWPSSPHAFAQPRRLRDPRALLEGGKLVKVGASRDGGTYEHRVTRRRFDLVLEQLRSMDPRRWA